MRLILIVPYNTVKNGISRGKLRDLGQIAEMVPEMQVWAKLQTKMPLKIMI